MFAGIIFACSVESIDTFPLPSWYPWAMVYCPATVDIVPVTPPLLGMVPVSFAPRAYAVLPVSSSAT